MGTSQVQGSVQGSGKLAGQFTGSSSGAVAAQAAGILGGSVSGVSQESSAIRATGTLIGPLLGTSQNLSRIQATGNLLGSFTGLSQSIGLVSSSSSGPTIIDIFSEGVMGQSSASGTLIGAGSLLGDLIGSSSLSASSAGQSAPSINLVYVSPYAVQVSSFGSISANNPAIIAKYSDTTQFFSQPQPFSEFRFAGFFGHELVNDTALIGPSASGRGPGRANYIVAAGDVFVPFDFTDGSFIISLYQNVFKQVGDTIQQTQYLWNQITVPLITPGVIQSWQMISSPNSLGSQEPMQLTLGIVLTGTSSGNPLVRLTQFGIQQIYYSKTSLH